MSFEGAMKDLNLETPSYNLEEIPSLSTDKLTEIKELIEANMYTLSDRLTSYGADMNTPLLTPDGFPRSDIDVVQIRLLRIKLIRLQNDIQCVLTELGKRLVLHFAQLAKENQKTQQTPSTDWKVPFAVIDLVVPNSPSDTAGLKVDDKIVSFGSINATNHNGLRNIVSVVKANIGSSIAITVLRDDQPATVSLNPSNNWGGDGLLGCKLSQV